MNITLPGNPVADIASSTTLAITSFSAPVELICGLLLAFLVIELIIGAMHHTTSTPGVEPTP